MKDNFKLYVVAYGILLLFILAMIASQIKQNTIEVIKITNFISGIR